MVYALKKFTYRKWSAIATLNNNDRVLKGFTPWSQADIDDLWKAFFG